MTFFPSSSGFIINGGYFISFQTENAVTIDGLIILKADDLELRRELQVINDGNNSYRIHAASRRGHLVAIKTFEGPRAKQDWKLNVAFLKKSIHPNVLRMVGISGKSSKSHFIQFDGIASEQNMQWLIANALGTDLDTSVQVSMKAVKGIAAGLNYIKDQKIPVMYAGTMNNNQKWDNFDILTGYDSEPVIAFHLSSTICEDGSVSQNLDIKTDSRGIEVLNGLCDQLFSGANFILYDDSPEREFEVYNSEGLLAAALEHKESTSNLSESEAMSNRSNPMENTKPSRKPRREVWWLDLGATNHSLESIGQCFKDRLNWSLLSSSDSSSLLRHIRSPKNDNLGWNLHQCPGYLREEITLTCDLSKSIIVSHTFPSPSERCPICHQLVQYTYSGSFDNSIISYYPPTPYPATPNNSLSSPVEGALTFDHFAPVGGIDPFTPIIGVRSSGASFVKGELFRPSLPFNGDIKSMQSMTDPNEWKKTEFQWMAQLRQNLGVDFGSGQTSSNSSSSTPFPDHMDAANQQTQQQQQQQSTNHAQLNKIGRLGTLTLGKNAKKKKWGFSGMFDADRSHQNPLPPVDETRPAVSFPSRNPAQSSSAGSRYKFESSPTREQQLPAQDSRDMKISKKEAERLRREKWQEERKLAEMTQREQARKVTLKPQQITRKHGDDIGWSSRGVGKELLKAWSGSPPPLPPSLASEAHLLSSNVLPPPSLSQPDAVAVGEYTSKRPPLPPTVPRNFTR